MLNYEYRPSLNLNFTIGDDIDPRVKTSCGTSTARTRWNKYGVLERVPANTPRLGYSISTGSPLGLMSEQQRTNSCTNGEVLGAVTGVLGSGGSLPTLFSLVSSAGLTTAVVGTSTDAKGVSHFILTITGTPTSDRYSILCEGSTSAACTVSQRWAGSFLLTIPTSTKTGVVYEGVEMATRTSVGVQTSAVLTTITPDSLYRIHHGKLTIPSGSERVTHSFVVGCSVGTPVSVTYKVGLVQLECGYGPTSFIPTSTVAVTRPDEVNMLYNVSNLLGKDQGTFTCEFIPASVDPAFNTAPTMFTYTNSAVTDYFRGSLSLTEFKPTFNVVKGGSSLSSILAGEAVRVSSANRVAFGFRDTGSYAVCDAFVSNVAATVGVYTYPSTADILYLGTRQSSVSANINGTLTQLQIYPMYIEPGEITQYTKGGGKSKADYSDI